MEKEEYLNQGLDLRRLLLILGGKLWLIFAGIVLGAAAGAAIYLLYTQVTNGMPEYRASSDYYISFNFDEFENGNDYYNAYTWDGILRNDPIVDYALTLLPQTVTKTMVQQAVSGEMLGDYRVLTVHVTTDDKALTEQISEAYHQSMVHFGESRDMLDHIEVWSRGEALPLEKNTKAPNAAFLGGLLGGLAALFFLLLYLVLEAGIYVEMDVMYQFKLPVFGLLTRKKEAAQEQMYKDNTDYAFGDRKVELWNAEEIPGREDYERLRKAEALLVAIPWGRKNRARTQRLLELMKLQQCEVKGLVIIEAKDSFVKAYYGKSQVREKKE